MNYENLDMTQQQYSDYVNKKAKNSNLGKDLFRAFWVGGAICMIGRGFMDLFIRLHFDEQTAGTISTVILVFLGALFTALDIYPKLGKYAGAGSIVPITGFSNSIVAPAIEFKSEGYVIGIGANMFKVAGPVLVYGVTTSVAIGFIYWIIKLFI